MGGGLVLHLCLRHSGHRTGASLARPRPHRCVPGSFWTPGPEDRGADRRRLRCLQTGLSVRGIEPTGEVRLFGRDLPDGVEGARHRAPESAQRFADEVRRRRHDLVERTDGGVLEDERFAAGTKTVAGRRRLQRGLHCRRKAVTPSRRSALVRARAARSSHLSSGGGAVLELIEHGDLPGLAALRDSFRTQVCTRRGLKVPEQVGQAAGFDPLPGSTHSTLDFWPTMPAEPRRGKSDDIRTRTDSLAAVMDSAIVTIPQGPASAGTHIGRHRGRESTGRCSVPDGAGKTTLLRLLPLSAIPLRGPSSPRRSAGLHRPPADPVRRRRREPRDR